LVKLSSQIDRLYIEFSKVSRKDWWRCQKAQDRVGNNQRITKSIDGDSAIARRITARVN
jgi:hypothetical protein